MHTVAMCRSAIAGLVIAMSIASAAHAAPAPASRDSAAIRQAGADLDRLRGIVRSGRYAEAESTARALVAANEGRLGPESPEVARLLDALAVTLWREGKARQPATRAVESRAIRI